MREIIFDTETTGLDPQRGDRMVEIGCIEMVNRVATGHTFHAYFNPERDMPAEAEAVHGLSSTFLADKPLFVEKAAELLEFIGECPLVAHNAGFDFGFLNAELTICGFEIVSRDVENLAAPILQALVAEGPTVEQQIDVARLIALEIKAFARPQRAK